MARNISKYRGRIQGWGVLLCVGSTDSHPEAVQISDRFYLIKGLSEAINKYIIREFPARVEIPLAEEIPEDRATSRERQHRLALQQKQQEVDEARKLVREGYPIGQIAAMMHHTCKTIQNYLNPSYRVTDGHYNARIPGKLAPYEKDVIELRSRGLHIPRSIRSFVKKGIPEVLRSLECSCKKKGPGCGSRTNPSLNSFRGNPCAS